jgi:methyl-accepting chemotaxis protein
VAGHKVAFLHFEANLDAVRTRVAQGLGPSMRARIIDTATNTVIADTASTTPILKSDLAKVAPWSGAAGPVRADGVVHLDEATNANRWVVQVRAPEPKPFTGGLLLRAAGLILLALLAIAVVAVNFASSIARPVTAVTEVAEGLAQGDLTQHTDVQRRDEIGRMATAVNKAVASMLQHQQAIQIAHDERQRQLRESHHQQQISDKQVRDRAQAVIDETAAAVLTELAEVVHSVDDVRAGANTIDQRVTGTSTVTQSLVEQAHSAERVVAALGDSLRTVGGVVDMISALASQTNLLALNATIESARAGQAGAAFSVVAREVKSLASSTAQSTQEITTTIATLERDAAAVASAIASMAGQVAVIDGATDDVTVVTAQQQTSVQQLDARVNGAITRIQAMAAITDDLERRGSHRYVAHIPATVAYGGATYSVEIQDLSVTGLRCTGQFGGPLADGDTLAVELTLDGHVLRVGATVVRAHQDPPLVDLGLHFTNPGADLTDRVRRYIATQIGLDPAETA